MIAGAAAYSACRSSSRHRSASVGRDHAAEPPVAVFALAAPGSPRVVREADDQLSLPVDRGTLATAAPPFPGPVSATADDRGARVDSAAARSPTSTKAWRWPSSIPTAHSGARSSSVRQPAARRAGSGDLRAQSRVAVRRDHDRSMDRHRAGSSTGSWLATVPEVGSVTIETSFRQSSWPNAGVDEMLAAGVARRVSRTPTADGTVTLVTELTRTCTAARCSAWRSSPPSRARAGSGAAAGIECHALRASPTTAVRGGQRPAAVKPDFESEAYFGSGWRDSERTPTGRVRRADGRATLLLPLAAGYSYRLSLDFARRRRASTRRSTGRWLGRVSSASERRVTSCCRPGSYATARLADPYRVPLSPSGPAPLIFRAPTSSGAASTRTISGIRVPSRRQTPNQILNHLSLGQ